MTNHHLRIVDLSGVKMIHLYDQLCVRNGVLYLQVSNSSEHLSNIFQLVVPKSQEEVMYGRNPYC